MRDAADRSMGPPLTVVVRSLDPRRRHDLEQLMRERADVILVAEVAGSAALPGKTATNLVLADWRSREGDLGALLAGYDGQTLVALVDDGDEDGTIELLRAGALAVLPGSANRNEIVAALAAAAGGLSTLPRSALERLLDPGSSGRLRPPAPGGSGRPPLTPREVEVLVAMADGASNKAIAQRLGLSFHTVKFHVAAILAKLDSDSRTEAVAHAARLGLVML